MSDMRTHVRIDIIANNEALVEFVVTHGTGIHARPAVMFTKLARSFPCVIELEVDGSGIWLNAKSIVKVLAARIRKGSTLKIVARGVRADEAVHALCMLVEGSFGEGMSHAGSG